MKIRREFHYDSAHRLPNLGEWHKCSRLHGHTYRLIVTLDGPVDPEKGWVMDFADVDRRVTPVIDQLDHRYLNDVLENPTVELQLEWLWDALSPSLPLHELTLYEGLNNSATYNEESR
jgi:6-pyruvoyltetrahydropterin/6-carboxytetrahydropterin synthase